MMLEEFAEYTCILSGEILPSSGLLDPVTVGKLSLSVMIKLERSVNSDWSAS